MGSDLESAVRTIRGIEYVISGDHHVQDFIRFTRICPLDPVEPSPPTDVIRRNAVIGDAAGICGTMASRAWIVGDSNFIPPLEDDDIAIGVHSAVFSPHVSHAFVSDPEGKLLPRLHESQSPPIGLLGILTHPLLAAQWHRKSAAGIWRLPAADHDFIREIAPNIRSEVYGLDSCAGAMHAAWLLMGCQEFILYHADLTFEDDKPGSVLLPDGRRIHESWASTLDVLAGVAHVFLRNGFVVTCFDGTMSVPPGAATVAPPST